MARKSQPPKEMTEAISSATIELLADIEQVCVVKDHGEAPF
jgi:hypothetical protein